MNNCSKLKIENLESELFTEELEKVSGGYAMSPYSPSEKGADMLGNGYFPAHDSRKGGPNFLDSDFGDKLRSSIEQSFPWNQSSPDFESYSQTKYPL